MSLICLNKNNKISFYKFPKWDPIINSFISGVVHLKLDSIDVMRNGLLTRYDASTPEVEFISKLCVGYYDYNLIYPPYYDNFSSIDYIVVEYGTMQ